MSFSFMHAADLHLGCLFSGIDELPLDLQQRVIDASLNAFKNLINCCIELSVDFVIISGDIFETNRPTLRVQKVFVEQLKRLAEFQIDTFIVTGNHDAAVFDNLVFTMPDNLYIFPTDAVKIYERVFNNMPIKIAGISYAQFEVEDLSIKFPQPDSEGFNIAILHCDVGGSDHRYSPVLLTDLEQKGYNYWALGHVHTMKQWINNSVIQYPGVLQGRHRAENGEKGCFLVKVASDKSIDSRFIEFQDIIWREVAIDLTETAPDMLVDMLLDVKEKNRSLGQVGCLLSLTLKGATRCHNWLQMSDESADLLLELREGEERLDNFVWVTSIIDRTNPVVDWNDLRNQENFLSEVILFIEELENSLTDQNAENKLHALSEATEIFTGVHGLKLEQKEILSKAKLLILQVLGEGE